MAWLLTTLLASGCGAGSDDAGAGTEVFSDSDSSMAGSVTGAGTRGDGGSGSLPDTRTSELQQSEDTTDQFADTTCDRGAEGCWNDSSEDSGAAESTGVPGDDGSDIDDSGTDDSGTDDSGTDDSGTGDSGTGDSGTDDSGTDDSGTGDSGTDDSGTDDSGSDDSGADDGDTDNGDTDGGDGEPGDGMGLVEPPFFERVMPAGLEDVWFNWDLSDYLSYGAGMAFVDTRGDGRFDLFIGAYNAADASPCLYRNVSTPGQLAFEPAEELCGQLGAYLAGLPVDLTGDGREELFLHGLGSAGLVFFHPELVYVPLHVRGEEGSPMAECLGVSSLALDATLDGAVEVVVGCAGLEEHWFAENVISPDFRGLLAFSRNVVFRWTGETLEAMERPEVDALRDIGSTLAMAPVDLEGNGRDAVVMGNESNSTPLRRRDWLREGVVQFRCLGTESCAFDEWPLLPNVEAWGSFMGAAQVHVGEEAFIYVTDWGHNRLLRRGADRFVDEAFERGAQTGIRGGHLVVSWSALVDDFNFSGRDDILVSNGLVLGDIQAWSAQMDTLLLQREDGTFQELTTEAGFHAPLGEGEDTLGEPYNARGGALVDLDGNGRLEAVLLNLAGELIVYRELAPVTEELPPRCTIIPEERTTAPLVSLVGIRGEGESGFRVRRAHGEMNVGLPRAVSTPHQRGTLRFASGAQVPFDCGGGAGPLRIAEPDWLAVSFGDDEVTVALTRDWLPADTQTSLSLIIRRSDGSRRVETLEGVPARGEVSLGLAEGDEAVMVIPDDFAVRRWWSRP